MIQNFWTNAAASTFNDIKARLSKVKKKLSILSSLLFHLADKA